METEEPLKMARSHRSELDDAFSFVLRSELEAARQGITKELLSMVEQREAYAEKLAYHANALHENCISCHKAYNKENKTKAAPSSCTKCHIGYGWEDENFDHTDASLIDT